MISMYVRTKHVLFILLLSSTLIMVIIIVEKELQIYTFLT